MENSTKIIIGILVTACILSGVTLTMSFMRQGNPIFLYNLDEQPLEPIILSGEYSGNHFFDRNVIVPEGNNVSLLDGEFLGGPIIVYGNLTVRNCVFDQIINILDNASSTFYNVSFKYGSQIRTHGYSRTSIEKIYYYKNISYISNALLNTFYHSIVLVNNSIITMQAAGYSKVNLTNIQNYTEQISSLVFYEYAEGFILNSTIDTIYSNEPIIYNLIPRPIIRLNNTKIDFFNAEGNTTSYLFQSSTIDTYQGWDNTILYNESSTTINNAFLFDSAQIVSI